MLQDQKASLSRFGVEFDVWFSERQLVDSGAVSWVIDTLQERGMVYEAEGALWLRTTEFGDEKDRVLVKSDGNYTYLAGDIAYHKNKLDRGFDLLIDIWGLTIMVCYTYPCRLTGVGASRQVWKSCFCNSYLLCLQANV